ncbi:hypothetical protein RRG08_001057 [Elysia crispata]|uniref:Uncharacterized protein n=1 Tax=Elysia crispata TaxID=231223 RepID=A0AAE1E597_9GAST|nr:hypothetical protein RRG08_001057 [Elysia crispata]
MLQLTLSGSTLDPSKQHAPGLCSRAPPVKVRRPAVTPRFTSRISRCPQRWPRSEGECSQPMWSAVYCPPKIIAFNCELENNERSVLLK